MVPVKNVLRTCGGMAMEGAPHPLYWSHADGQGAAVSGLHPSKVHNLQDPLFFSIQGEVVSLVTMRSGSPPLPGRVSRRYCWSGPPPLCHKQTLPSC